ncbi:hypothetical protein [Nocardia tengchongensis]|uniref:hypothetical protein n=1 Tax=Nocardia tengchongensis TaxID=2055889 RepID=UPI003648FD9F
MRLQRITLALSACAAVAMSLAGSPLAMADIGLSVTTGGNYDGESSKWTIFMVVSCDPSTTPQAPPVYVTDNGASIPQSPLAVTGCSQYNWAYPRAPFNPTSLGMHHIVATQYKPDGSVLSTTSQDVDVTSLPCISSGSALFPCK